MKLIILDHLKRWRLVLAAILIAYFAIMAFSTREKNSQTSDDPTVASVQDMIHTVHGSFVFQVIMVLGFLLMWDIQRGLPRVLTSLPLKSKQIGRAWWLATVGFPAIALGIIGVPAILIYSSEKNMIVLLQSYFWNWLLAALYLGAVFGGLTLVTQQWSDTFIGKLRTFLQNSFAGFIIFGFIFVQLGFVAPVGADLIIAAFTILFVLGWFRAERMVLQRASFRPASQSSHRKPTQHKTAQGFGGLPFLAWKIFSQTTLLSFALIVWMVFAMTVIFHNHNLPQTIIPMSNGGATPLIFFLLIFSIVPVANQMRSLRTLPISPLMLVATAVFLPVISIAIVGLIVMAVAFAAAGETVVLPVACIFLALEAKIVIAVPLVIWRGLGMLTYIFILVMIVSGSFLSLGMTMIFHLHSTTDYPLWVYLTVLFLCVAASFALTHRLLTKSSSAYRVRTMPANAWNMLRR